MARLTRWVLRGWVARGPVRRMTLQRYYDWLRKRMHRMDGGKVA